MLLTSKLIKNILDLCHAKDQYQSLLEKNSSEKHSGWMIDSVVDHTISISKYNLLAGNIDCNINVKPNRKIPVVFYYL